MAVVPTHHLSSPRKRGPSTPGRLRSNRDATAYWVARSSRAMTGENDDAGSDSLSSPSLSWRDDFDLVAGFERRLGPAAARQHIKVQRDGKMAALIFEFAEQGVDAL